MRFTTFALFVSVSIVAGCASNSEMATDGPAESQANGSLIIATPQAPAVDRGLDSHNGTGTMDHDENQSSSPAGGNPQIGGH